MGGLARPGLFAAVIGRKREDACTEVLAALLRDDEAWRPTLAALLPEEAIGLDRPQTVLTQRVADDGSRPDLVLDWPSKRRIVEVKFRAPLTVAQQDGYAVPPVATPGLPSVLYVLGPKSRRNEVCPQIVDDTHFIAWEDVHARLEKTVAAGGTERVRFWVEELLAAIRQEAGMSDFRALTPAESDALRGRALPEGLGNALDLVDALRRELAALPATQASHSEGLAYGFMIDCMLPGEKNWAWAGFWMAPWRAFGESPLWIQLWSTAPLGDVEGRNLGARRFPDYMANSYVIPIPLLPEWSAREYAVDVQRILDAVAPAACIGR